MSYRDRLAPWCIFCLLPHAQRKLVARLRRRSDAEECLKALQRMNPDYDYVLIFDPGDSDTEREIDRPPIHPSTHPPSSTHPPIHPHPSSLLLPPSSLILPPSSFCLSK
jgi:hypothetical protein